MRGTRWGVICAARIDLRVWICGRLTCVCIYGCVMALKEYFKEGNKVGGAWDLHAQLCAWACVCLVSGCKWELGWWVRACGGPEAGEQGGGALCALHTNTGACALTVCVCVARVGLCV